jgi:hypothetical protein
LIALRQSPFHDAFLTGQGLLCVQALDYDEEVRGWVAVTAFVCIGVLVEARCAQAVDFELIGQMEPKQPLPVYLQGATTPFKATTEADPSGRFHFRKLVLGT